MNSLIRSLLKVALLLGIFTIFISCKTEKPTLAKIRVLDSDLNVVEGAEVTLCPCPDPILAQTVDSDVGITDEDGYIIFDYTDIHDLGTAGFRVMDIHVNVGDSLFGYGIIKIYEEEENVEQVVVSVP